MVFHIMTIELLIEVYNFTEEKTVSLFKIKADHCIWEDDEGNTSSLKQNNMNLCKILKNKRTMMNCLYFHYCGRLKLIQTVSLYMKINKRKERRQREYLTQDAECGLLLHQNNTRTVIDFKETSVDIENEMSLKRRVGKMINEVMQIEMDTIDDTWMYGFMHVDHKLKDRKKVYFGKNIEVGLLVDNNNASGATEYMEVSVDIQNMQTLKKPGLYSGKKARRRC